MYEPTDLHPRPGANGGPGSENGSGPDVAESAGDTAADADSAARLDRTARPLLKLVQRIAGMETAFVTVIDWAAQKQEIVFALNSSQLEVPEGTVIDWQDASCRWTLLSGKWHSDDVPGDFPGSIAAEQLGIRSYLAVPILDGGSVIGTVCGASRAVVELAGDQLEMVQLVAEALAVQVRSDMFARSMETLALTDPLTGLANRRGFTSRWEQALAASGRHGHPIALVVADVDEFKLVNDTHGHLGGDRVLKAMGDVLRAVSRAEDVTGRVGGDEFALALPFTESEGASGVAERVRVGFAELTHALPMPCTVSIGVSGSDLTLRRDLMEAADMALYQGKHLGRDRVAIWSARRSGRVERFGSS